jgi:hypothetical protein
VAIRPGPSTFTRIFLPFSSFSHVRAKERNAALLAAYTPKPGKPFIEATDPVMMIDPPSLNNGNAFWTDKAHGPNSFGASLWQAVTSSLAESNYECDDG